MNEKITNFDMEITVPIQQIKTRFFFAKIFDISLHVIISGERMRKGEYRDTGRVREKPK